MTKKKSRLRAAAAGHAPVVLDIAGCELSKTDRKRLKHPLTGGLILFSRNWSAEDGRHGLTRLCAEVKALRPDLLICVDHEGGRVQRFREDGFTHLPPMHLLGDLWSQGSHDDGGGRSAALEAMQRATACGHVLAAELRACGIDLSFAPVLDLDHGPSGVIGDRAFARDPRVVALLAKSLMHGMLQAGMANCGKHFPGHGFASADSHLDAAHDPRTLAEILADDAAPYRWLTGTLSAVMPAHVVYPAVDARPAGFSRRWLRDVLRTQLAFDGLIFSDDLSMNAARRLDEQDLSYCDAAFAALDAGCDMVLLCNQSLGAGDAVDELLAGLEAALDDGRWRPDAHQHDRRLALLPRSAPLRWNDLMVDPGYLQALSLLP